MWDLWCTKWYSDTFFPDYFGFPLSISFRRCFITRKNETKSSSSQSYTISLQAAVRPQNLLWGPSHKKKRRLSDTDYCGIQTLLIQTRVCDITECSFTQPAYSGTAMERIFPVADRFLLIQELEVWILGTPHSQNCKNVPLNTGFRYVQLLFQTRFTVF